MSTPNVNVIINGPKNNATSTYKEVLLKANISFADQVTEEGRRYVVKWDFDLEGSTVNIPDNCVLDFQGGSVVNGKLIGCNTKLQGLYENSTALYGMYYDLNGESLSYNYQKKEPLLSNIEFGYSNSSADLSGRHSVESMVVTSNYIFTFTVVNSTDAEVDVLDRNYNIIKECPLSRATHCNDATLFGDSILLQSPTAGKVFSIKISDILNAENGQTVTVDSISWDFPYALTSIDYDSEKEELCVWGGSYMYIFDKNFTVLSSMELSRASMEAVVGNPVTAQGMLYKNGIASFYFWNHTLNQMNPSGAVIVNVDSNNGDIDIYDIYGYPYIDAEMQGPSKDPDDPDIVWNAVNVRVSSSTFCRFTILVKNSMHTLFSGESIKINNANSLCDPGRTIYVNNSYTGKSMGSAGQPYKRLDTAIAMSIFGDTYVTININNTGEPYYMPPVTLFEKSIKLIGSGTGLPTIIGNFRTNTALTTLLSKVHIEGNITIFGGTFYIRDSEIENSSLAVTLTYCRGSIQDSDITVSSSSGVSIQGSHVYLSNTNIINSNLTQNYSGLICNESVVSFVQDSIFSASNFRQAIWPQNSFLYLCSGITASNVNKLISAQAGQGKAACFMDVVSSEHLNAISRWITLGVLDGIIRINVMSSDLIYGGVTIEKGIYTIANNKLILLSNYSNDPTEPKIGETRPVSVAVGSMFFDTTLSTDGKPIWWNGTAWVDATGTEV